MTAPRVEIDLHAIAHNARALVDRLAVKGIRATGVCKGAVASPSVAMAMLCGGVTGLGDSRMENAVRLRTAGVAAPITLIRSSMLSDVARVVRHTDISLNTEPVVLVALSAAAVRQGATHAVILMVELGDLREGVAVDDVVDLSRAVTRRPGVRLAGLGTNLACQSGVIPDQPKMDQLSGLVDQVEAACGRDLAVVSGGNSANLEWALTTDQIGRIDELRLGESILLGTETLHRRPIEAKAKPTQPWGSLAQTAFGDPPSRYGTGTVRQVILGVGRQDVDPDGLTPPEGMTILGAPVATTWLSRSATTPCRSVTNSPSTSATAH